MEQITALMNKASELDIDLIILARSEDQVLADTNTHEPAEVVKDIMPQFPEVYTTIVKCSDGRITRMKYLDNCN